jgi:hypothetical protein
MAEAEYAVQMRDRSVDKLILRNEFAMCKPIKPGPIDITQFRVNDLLHVERTRCGVREASIRRVRSADGRLTLATYSSDPKLRNEITYPSTSGEVTILGIVVGKHVRFGFPKLR